MRIIIFFITFLTTINCSIAQEIGIYKTYDDFLNGNIEAYSEWRKTMHIMGSFSVFFINDRGKQIKFKVDRKKMWGFSTGDRILRVNQKNDPYVILEVGDLVIYTNYSTKITGNRANWSANQFVPLFSKDLNSPLQKLTKKNLFKVIPPNTIYSKELENTSNNILALFDFVKYYNYKNSTSNNME